MLLALRLYPGPVGKLARPLEASLSFIGTRVIFLMVLSRCFMSPHPVRKPKNPSGSEKTDMEVGGRPAGKLVCGLEQRREVHGSPVSVNKLRYMQI